MKRETQKRVKERKQEAAELVQYANPKSRKRSSTSRVKALLSRYIPYREKTPFITSVKVKNYSKNSLIKSADFVVKTADGNVYDITAYQNLVGRTLEERKADKTASFPSGLFKVFTEKRK